jgi:hypothetical protein
VLAALATFRDRSRGKEAHAAATSAGMVSRARQDSRRMCFMWCFGLCVTLGRCKVAAQMHELQREFDSMMQNRTRMASKLVGGHDVPSTVSDACPAHPSLTRGVLVVTPLLRILISVGRVGRQSHHVLL